VFDCTALERVYAAHRLLHTTHKCSVRNAMVKVPYLEMVDPQLADAEFRCFA
jgi:hypothetical protein